MPRICITSRLITDLPADAIITTIEMEGDEPTITDQAINRLTSSHFHHRAKKMLPLPDGTAIKVERVQQYPVRFNNVIFVIDEGRLDVGQIVYNGLVAADKELMDTVSISIPRFDKKKSVVFKHFDDACSSIKKAIERHHVDFPNSRLRTINISCSAHEKLAERAEACFK